MLADPGSWQRPIPRETGQAALIPSASVGTGSLNWNQHEEEGPSEAPPRRFSEGTVTDQGQN